MDNKQAINEAPAFNPPEYGRKAPFSSWPTAAESIKTATSAAAKLALDPFSFVQRTSCDHQTDQCTYTHTQTHGVDCGTSKLRRVCGLHLRLGHLLQKQSGRMCSRLIFSNQIKAFPLANFFGREVGRQSRRMGHSNRQEPVTIDN